MPFRNSPVFDVEDRLYNLAPSHAGGRKVPEREITDRLAAGETLLLDGGTGSELQRRGADVLKGATERLEAWSATAA